MFTYVYFLYFYCIDCIVVLTNRNRNDIHTHGEEIESKKRKNGKVMFLKAKYCFSKTLIQVSDVVATRCHLCSTNHSSKRRRGAIQCLSTAHDD